MEVGWELQVRCWVMMDVMLSGSRNFPSVEYFRNISGSRISLLLGVYEGCLLLHSDLLKLLTFLCNKTGVISNTSYYLLGAEL